MMLLPPPPPPPLTIILILLLAISTIASSAQPYHALVSPITKDSSTSLYSITLGPKDGGYVIDLSSPFSWRRCDPHDTILPCGSQQCVAAGRYQPHPKSCPHQSRVQIGGKNDSRSGHQFCLCAVTESNPVTKSCASSELAVHNVVIPSTDGHVPKANITVNGVPFACAPESLFHALPSGSSGMASLSPSSLSLPSLFKKAIGATAVNKQFAICLPSSSSSPGVSFFGNGPFYLLPPPGIDVTQLLAFTPLLKNPVMKHNLDYYIDVRSICINGEAASFLRRMLEFDSLGHGGVKLSTVVPYTTLRSHVYRPFLALFARLTRGIPRAKKVKPFDLCLNTSALGSTRVGLPVPWIDLVLGNGKNWTIVGANSMKQVSNDVACLAFVNGGERAEQAVVVGSYQMENNFLSFDLVGQKLGFSSSLLFRQTTCSNFNFTSSS
ncbi:hypothetical protein EUGRSUZ_L02681 [Eucalyptus grandis]|uniref:Peptidase A1 domain-containing protein n=1 Tax=Eucalyptus grandis TaxID=71139 RepID=A0AAD9T9U2_EUCGR|nr:hypothetical protein EUGRSUZ_L02681 [Eucalyptus grandis]